MSNYVNINVTTDATAVIVNFEGVVIAPPQTFELLGQEVQTLDTGDENVPVDVQNFGDHAEVTATAAGKYFNAKITATTDGNARVDFTGSIKVSNNEYHQLMEKLKEVGDNILPANAVVSESKFDYEKGGNVSIEWEGDLRISA